MTALLLILLSAWPFKCSGLPSDQFITCNQVLQSSILHGVPSDVALSLAWNESRFERDLISPVGAVGPMQVMPRYACPRGVTEGCNLTDAGMRVLKGHLRKGDMAKALCHYNAGNVCIPRARRFARRVLRDAEQLQVGIKPWVR